MNIDDVYRRAEEVRESAGDPEAAHALEDSLHLDVLTAIAEMRAEDPVAMARHAIRTSDFDFPRWCA